MGAKFYRRSTFPCSNPHMVAVPFLNMVYTDNSLSKKVKEKKVLVCKPEISARHPVIYQRQNTHSTNEDSAVKWLRKISLRAKAL